MVCCKNITAWKQPHIISGLFSGSQGIAAIFLPGTGRVCEKSVWSAKGNYQFIRPHGGRKRGKFMAFFTSAITILQTLVVALGAGLAVWGVINLLEGYGNDNPGAKSQGIKQLMAGGGVALIGTQLVPLLANLFS